MSAGGQGDNRKLSITSRRFKIDLKDTGTGLLMSQRMKPVPPCSTASFSTQKQVLEATARI